MKILALGTFALSLVESNSNVGISGPEFFERISVQEERALEKNKLKVSVEGIKFSFAETQHYVLSAAADTSLLGHLNRRLSAQAVTQK